MSGDAIPVPEVEPEGPAEVNNINVKKINVRAPQKPKTLGSIPKRV